MDLTKVKELLEGANLSDEQIKALDTFFATYTEEVRDKVKEELSGKAFNESGEEMIPKSVAEEAFKKFQDDAKTAFNLFKEDSEKAFDLFKEDAHKAFQLYSEDLQEEYSENMIKGLQELYQDVEERVKRDFMESKDASILEQIKKLLVPLVASEEQQALLEEIEKLRSEKNEILEETKDLTRENIINTLVQDFPQEYVEDVKEYLEAAKNDDDIYERFSFICEMIDKGAFKPSKKEAFTEEETKAKQKKKTTQKKDKKAKVKPKKMIAEELDKQPTASVKSKSVEKKVKEEESNKYFTEEDDALISMIFSS